MLPVLGQMADIHKVYLSSLLLAYLLQHQKTDLLTSPLLSLLIASLLARYFQVRTLLSLLISLSLSLARSTSL